MPPGSVKLVAALVAAACVSCSSVRSSPIHDVSNVLDVPVTFRNGDVSLAGTLFLPDDNRRHPAVVLFHGSGPQPRNLFMGRWFAQHGVAALTYDKRGVGGSSGDFRTISFTDLVGDGLAAVDLLKARSDINPKQIGAWGLSQGGWLGPLAASRSKDVAFVIAVSGPGVSPGEQMIFYYGRQLHARGFSDREVDDAGDFRRKVWHFLSTGEGSDDARTALDRARSQPWFGAINEQSDGLFGRSTSDLLNDPTLRERTRFRLEANYDPKVALLALTVPSLFIFGDKDELVPVEQSVTIIRQTLTHPGHPPFSIVVFPGADHVIAVSSPDGGRPLAPGYLDTIADWLRKTLS
jgi:uncharacterized protein